METMSGPQPTELPWELAFKQLLISCVLRKLEFTNVVIIMTIILAKKGRTDKKVTVNFDDQERFSDLIA